MKDFNLMVRGRVGRAPARLWSMLAAGVVMLVGVSQVQANMLPNGLPDPRLLHVNVGSTAPSVSLNSLGFAGLHASYNVSGDGVKIGVISDSYNTNSVVLPVPGNLTVIKDDLDTDYLALPGNVNPTDSGRAMLAVLNHIAPDATYYFHSAFNNDFTSANANEKVSTPQSMVTAIDALVAQGVDIIVDSTGYLNSPWHTDGGNPNIKRTIAQAVNDAKAAGVSYFAGAGQQNAQSFEGVFTPNRGFHDFGQGVGGTDRTSLDITVAPGATIRVALQWVDKFETLGQGNTLGDLDMTLIFTGEVSDPTSVRDQRSENDADGDGEPDEDPWELLTWTNTGNSAANVALRVFSGDPLALNTNLPFKIILDGDATFDPADVLDPANELGNWTVAGHPSALGAITIASYDSGIDVDADSGLAGADILVGPNGGAINETRDTDLLNPMLTGLDDFDLSALGIPGLSTFDGTGAAASYVAGVAALLLEAAQDAGNPLTPDQLFALLRDTAIDLETVEFPPGFDNLSGFGLIDPAASVDRAAIPEPATFVLMSLAACLFATRSRKDRAK